MNDTNTYENLERGRKLSAKQLKAAEDELNTAPNDVNLRLQIIGRLTGPHWKNEPAQIKRAEHILWFIRNIPDHPVLADAEGQIIFDEPRYSEAKTLLVGKLEQDSNNVQLIRNVAFWTLLEDDGMAETLLQKGEQLQPHDPDWALFLSVLYGIRADRSSDRSEKQRWKKLEHEALERRLRLQQERNTKKGT